MDRIFLPNNCAQQATKFIDSVRQILLSNWDLHLKPCKTNKNQNSCSMYHFVLAENLEDEFRPCRANSRQEKAEQLRQTKIKKLNRKICNNTNEILSHNALIFIVLGSIVLQGGQLRKDEFNKYIWDDIDCTQHAKTPEKLIQMLKQEKWIIEETTADNDDTLYKLGVRTYVEFLPQDIYRCVYKLVNKTFPKAEDPALQRILGINDATNPHIDNMSEMINGAANNRNMNSNNNNNYSNGNARGRGKGRGKGRGRASQRASQRR